MRSTLPRPVPPPLAIRAATLADVPALVTLNHEAYPDLVEQGVVWDAEQLAQHIALFPEGQRVAVDEGGAILGAISTLVPRGDVDPLAQHTWYEITDRGRFTTHAPGGDTLYLADVYVSPAAWGRGVGKALYAELVAVARRGGQRRIVAGGRLWGYFEYEGRLTPEAYVEKVIAGEIRDRVLGSQLRAGFRVEGILRDYLVDARSGNYATLLVLDVDALRTARASGPSRGQSPRRRRADVAWARHGRSHEADDVRARRR